MPSAVKLSDEIVKDARREARLMKRSIAGQVEYWASLGRSIENSGLFSVEQVRAVLNGEGSVQHLTPAEGALYLELLSQKLESLDGTPTTGILRELEEAGLPIAGEDDEGKLREYLKTRPGGK